MVGDCFFFHDVHILISAGGRSFGGRERRIYCVLFVRRIGWRFRVLLEYFIGAMIRYMVILKSKLASLFVV